MTLPTRAGLRSRASFERFLCEHQKIDTGLKFLVAESVCEINPLKSKKYRFLDQSLEKKYLRGPLSAFLLRESAGAERAHPQSDTGKKWVVGVGPLKILHT